MAVQSKIVRHREGWCMIPPGADFDPLALNDPTVCGYVVNLRSGSKRGKPTCPDCLVWLDGWESGKKDAADSNQPMSETQLSYHSTLYANGYRKGYGNVPVTVKDASK